MSEEDVEIVRGAIEAFQAGFERGDPGFPWDTGVMTDDAEWVPAREIPGPRSYRGREGFVEFMRTWTELFDSWSFRVEQLIDAGDDRVVAIVSQKATGRESGAAVEMRYGSVYELEGGRVSRVRNYLEPAKALEAAGLQE